MFLKMMKTLKKMTASERAMAWNKAHPERARAAGKRYQKKLRERNPWFTSFTMAKQRCMNPNATGYARYGGRGIKFLLTKEEVAELWERDYACLMDQLSLDRIDNDGDYTFENCQFLPRSWNSRKYQEDHKEEFRRIRFDSWARRRKLNV